VVTGYREQDHGWQHASRGLQVEGCYLSGVDRPICYGDGLGGVATDCLVVDRAIGWCDSWVSALWAGISGIWQSGYPECIYLKVFTLSLYVVKQVWQLHCCCCVVCVCTACSASIGNITVWSVVSAPCSVSTGADVRLKQVVGWAHVLSLWEKDYQHCQSMTSRSECYVVVNE